MVDISEACKGLQLVNTSTNRSLDTSIEEMLTMTADQDLSPTLICSLV